MAIPESQLETWARQGAVTTSAATHTAIRSALFATGSPLIGKNIEPYLQGSYKNDTNIRGDSDVDLVVQLNNTFRYDLSKLAVDQRQLFEASYGSATYSWDNFRSDVLQVLRSAFGSAVTEGKKAIKIAATSGRLPADVVVCLQYRRYKSFRGLGSESYVPGIVLYSLPDRRTVINFPIPHYDNGVSKNGQYRTNGWYKPTVRMLKNIRGRLVDDRLLTKDDVPSYFLECMTYNIPDNCFGKNYGDTFCAVINWLNKAEMSTFLCQNEELQLFGNLPEQWNTASANKFLATAVTLWNNW